MNILLANLQWGYDADKSPEKMRHLHFPLGLGIIAGEIQKNRKDNLFVIDNYIQDVTDEQVVNFIDINKIDCILLSMFLGNFQYYYLKRFIDNLTDIFPQLYVIIGGPLASTIPGLLIENTTASNKQVICVLGEGEETIVELLECIESKGNLNKVRGIAYKDTGVITTALRPRISDLDNCSRPAYDLFDTKEYVEYTRKTGRCWEIITSRGCYGSCIYCKLVFGKKITMRSAASIVKEMEDFYSAYGINRFNFVDDNFLNYAQQISDFSNALEKSDIKFKWRFQGRADRFSPFLADILIKVGLYDVTFGIESGSPEIIQEMDKHLNLEDALRNLRSMPDGLDTHGSLVVGMPNESHVTIEQTRQFIQDSGLKHIYAGILTLFPGTRIFNIAKKRGLITDEDSYCENLGPIYVKPYVNLTSYSDEQIIQWAELLNSINNNLIRSDA